MSTSMSSRVTRSQTARQNANSTAVHWSFFDPNNLDFLPLIIRIPSELFSGPTQECRTLFMEELEKEFDFFAKESSIKFWRPENKLSVDSAENDWEKFADGTSFKETFKRIRFIDSFSTKLGECAPEFLHLVVTAEEIDHKAAVQDEARDKVYALPEFGRYDRIVNTKGHAPSEGARSQGYYAVQKTLGEVIHDGRYPLDPPIITVAPPIHIYHPIFDEFLRIIGDNTIQPSIEDLCKTQDMMVFLSRIFPGKQHDENARNRFILEHLQKLLHPDIKVEKNSDNTEPDGILKLGDFIQFIIETKRELGEGGSDPSTQAGISYRRSYILDRHKEIRDKSCCPVFLLAGGGPWLCVMGAVMPDKVIVQRLTDMKWAGLSSTEEDKRVYETARIFLALKTCIQKLENYYAEVKAAATLNFIKDEPHPRYYPYPLSFTFKEQTIKFNYVRALEEDAACVTFKAEITKDSPLLASKKIVVKFVARYGEDAHKLLAKHGYAPALYYSGPIPLALGYEKRLEGIPGPGDKGPDGLCLRSDTMHMIVMEYIEHKKFNERGEIPKSCRKDIETILGTLHMGGYAFGDLRTRNILLEEASTGKFKVKLIDFNWCGAYDLSSAKAAEGLPENLREKLKDFKKHGKPYAHYPLSLTTEGINWHKDVKPLQPILPAHDWAMVNQLDWAN